MSFENLNLISPIKTALAAEGYVKPTPIQEKAIPVILERKDLLGCAQTGTGKTAAFAIPVLQLLTETTLNKKNKRFVRALVLTPTRELAVQIGQSFATYGKHTGLFNTVVYGGVSQQKQTDKLRKGVDILIATPGRLLDLMNQGFVNLQNLELLVLDEADRMLDMGFIVDVKKIIEKMPEKRQTLFFSATMPPAIVKLSNSILTNPVKIEIAPESSTVDAIKQGVYFVSRPDKKSLLIHLLKNEAISSALVFTRTKNGADQVSRLLNNAKIKADAIHGNKSQNARQRALNNFKDKKVKVLVATDIAARGIDIEQLSHVINYEIPEFSESYVHRIGRTGRAGLSGTALSFCDSEERYYLKEINKLIKKTIPVISDHPFAAKAGDDIDVPYKIHDKTRNKKFSGKRKQDSFNPKAGRKKHRNRKSFSGKFIQPAA